MSLPPRTLLLLALLLPAGPSPAQAAGAATAARGFERVLWIAGDKAVDPSYLRQVREAGFTAVNLGADADVAPVRAAGLGYYLDQPAGKGWLEVRDADWEPLVRAYERDRDGRALVRPQCLQDPGLRVAVGARAAAAAARLCGPGLRFVALADEASATRHDNPLDVCRCDRCVAAFRAFVQQRLGSITALDAAWGTEFADWDSFAPLTTDQVRRRELGGLLLPANLRPFGEWLEFVDAQFAAAVAHLAEQVRREAPGVPVGLTGLQPPLAFGGHDYARLLPPLTLIEAYDLGAAPALAQSLQPAAARYSTLAVPADAGSFRDLATARLCAAAARGDHGVVVWNGAAVLADGSVTPAGNALQQALQRMAPALDACAGAELQASDVFVVESQSSVRAWWMLDSAKDGLTWVRRLQSYEASHSTSMAARAGWTALLRDLGLTGRFVGEVELPERLLQERPRTVVLPATIALSDRACQAIHAYLRTGGTVLADHSTALYDEHLVLRASAGLDDAFGITERSRRVDDLLVREGRKTAGSAPRVAEAGLRGEVGERSAAGDVFVERQVGRGRAVYLNLAVCDYVGARLDPERTAPAQDLRRRVRQVLQAARALPPFDVRGEGLPTCLWRSALRTPGGRTILAVRIGALDRPELLAQLARTPARVARLTFPRAVHLRTLAGEDLGRAATFELPLDAYAGLFVEDLGP